jgi:hypothetical protein
MTADVGAIVHVTADGAVGVSRQAAALAATIVNGADRISARIVAYFTAHRLLTIIVPNGRG